MADSAALLQDPGSRITYSNTGSAITAKDVVPLVVGSSGCVGIAINDIAATSGTGPVQIDGVWTLPKATGEAFTLGQMLYWDDSNNNLTGTSSSTFYRVGRATAAAASAATTAPVKVGWF